ncbi:MAG: hypothetical protein PHQ23_05835 [Candidatus Wallbacteria bacterium]|nr:hypothetical protein [Candidatus Wallbacteria bacterium]
MQTEYREWDFDEWEKAWSISVGEVYTCSECRNMLIVSKGGTGSLDLKCCGKPMTLYRGCGDAA